MPVIEMTFGQYVNELVNLYKVRAGMSGDHARRMLIDMLDEVFDSYQKDISPQEYFNEDVNCWAE